MMSSVTTWMTAQALKKLVMSSSIMYHRVWRCVSLPSQYQKMADIDKWIDIARECKYLPENDLKVISSLYWSKKRF
jgi:hypothetical protein